MVYVTLHWLIPSFNPQGTNIGLTVIQHCRHWPNNKSTFVIMSAIMCKQLHNQKATFYLANIVKTSDDIFDVAYDKCNLFLDLAVYIT